MKISKRKLFSKLVVIYLIVGILIQSSIANAGQGIFLNYSTTIKLGANLEYLKKTVTNQQAQISEYKGITANLENKAKLQEIKIDGLNLDKGIQTERANKLQENYTQCTKDLENEKDSRPSRFTWFGMGFLTAVIVSLAAAFAIK